MQESSNKPSVYTNRLRGSSGPSPTAQKLPWTGSTDDKLDHRFVRDTIQKKAQRHQQLERMKTAVKIVQHPSTEGNAQIKNLRLRFLQGSLPSARHFRGCREEPAEAIEFGSEIWGR